MSINEYFNKAKLISDTLFAAGKTLSPIEFTTYLLAGLGADYDSLVTSIMTRLDLLSPEEVYNHLLTHESRLSHPNITTTALDPSFGGRGSQGFP